MAQGLQSSNEFIASDISSIAAADVADDATDFTGLPLDVSDVETIFVTCQVTGGNSSNALGCVFKFLASADGVHYTTEYFVELTVLMLGTAEVVQGWHLNVAGVHYIKLEQIENEETVGGRTATAVNARWGKSNA